ncbi:hypothetical protein [Marispirochaeta sp.]|uniref:hypothetical protein n=1 Tax=Marispirochaeta sp. TaxID=2038653 RepID=UPI0029C94114|nr:hypothetical protein [Marispirochaeta sp.]
MTETEPRGLQGRVSGQPALRTKAGIPAGVVFIAFTLMTTITWAQEIQDDWSSGWSDAVESESAAVGGEHGDSSAFAGTAAALYGYVETIGVTQFPSGDSPAVGSSTRARLKGEWHPEERITARVEMLYEQQLGIANGLVGLNSAGINPQPEIQAENQQDDFTQSFTVDHVYAIVNLDRVDVSLGRMPIAWGVGYVFNPTDRVNTAGSLQGSEEETPGTGAVSLAFHFPFAWSLESYLAFEPGGTGGAALVEMSQADNLPFGVRLRGNVLGFDLSLSALRGVWYSGEAGGYDISVDPAVAAEKWEVDYRLGADAIGNIGPLGAYVEAALALPQTGNEIDFGATRDSAYSLERALDTVVGLEYITRNDVSFKVEYAHLGGGAAHKDSYDPSRVLSGRAITMGRDYLFLYASGIVAEFWELTFGTLGNLRDGSVVLTHEVIYDIRDNMELTASATVPFGKRGSEYDGRVSALDGVDLYATEVNLGVRVSF